MDQGDLACGLSGMVPCSDLPPGYEAGRFHLLSVVIFCVLLRDTYRPAETKLYGNLNAKSTNCGRKIKLTNTNNGKSVSVTVADACPTCPDENDLDLSFAAFTSIATEEEGEVPIVWHFDD